MAFARKLLQLHDVGVVVKEQSIGRVAIATGTPDFLVITLNALGQIIMNNPAHIAFIYAHSKGDGGHNHP